MARLFGRPPRAARGLSVSLDDLDALLRRSGVHEGGLAEAVVTLTGPVTVRADRIADEERAWAEAFKRIEAASAGRAELAEWLVRIRDHRSREAARRRLTRGGRELLDALASVLVALPRPGGESLSAFAARVTGRAHALDEGSPLGTLALGAARALAGLEAPGPDESPAEARREAWAAVGVLCDELSSIVLTLGLPGDASVTGQAAGGRPRRRRAAVAHAPPARPRPAGVARDRRRPRGGEPVGRRARRRRARGPLPRRSSARTVNPARPRWCCCAHSPRPAFGCATTATSTGAGSRSATSCTADCPSSHGSSTVTPIFRRRRSPACRAVERGAGRGQLGLKTHGSHARHWPADRRGARSRRPAGDAPLSWQGAAVHELLPRSAGQRLGHQGDSRFTPSCSLWNRRDEARGSDRHGRHHAGGIADRHLAGQVAVVG